MKTSGQILLLAAAVILGAGCTISGPAYSGPRLPREQVALVTSDDTLEIARIDDRRYFRRPVQNVEVLPGEHTFTVVYFGVKNARRIHTQEISVPLNAKAGHSYRMTAAIGTNQGTFASIQIGKVFIKVHDVTKAN